MIKIHKYLLLLFWAFSIAILPSAKVIADTYSTTCIEGYDCALYDPNANCSASDTESSTLNTDDPVSAFLHALAFQENGGDVIGTSGTGAKGKFQYMDGTWKASAEAYYPPAAKYASANDAPEAVQDAVAYLEYTVKYQTFKGDFFKMAVSHFLPAALSNDSLMDVVPPGNRLSPRQYGELTIKHMKEGAGKSIVFKWDQAPEFIKWLEKAGGKAAGFTSDSPSSENSCQCTNNSGAGSSNKTIIVIDPGHGPSRTTVDAKTGLHMVEQPGGAGDEIGHAWNVANIMKDDLEKDGYKVLLTKKDINDDVTFRDRANTADNNNAALALSIHGDSTLANDGEIYVQKVGLFRGAGSNKVTFDNAQVATKSQNYADIFKEQREKVSGGNVVIKDNEFNSRGIGMEPGNIPMVQLLSSTPWIYNEKHMPFNDREYAHELEAGVKKAVPASGANRVNSGSGCAAPSGSSQAAVDLAMKYAWPDGSHGLTPRDTYAQAVQAHPKEYRGGCNGADCGAFVTRVMRDSGADKNYNQSECNTVCQKKYMDDHPEKYENLGTKTSTKDLQPGDIAITRDTHTYMYVGPQKDHPDFKGDAASASQCERMPNASNTYFTDVNGVPFTWYRLKGGS